VPTATIFMNNRSQAIRLPKAAAFPPGVKHVNIRVEGTTRIITPVADSWQEWARNRQAGDPSFMDPRDQGTFDRRDWAD